MDSGYYAACSGLLAQVQALDVTANNLANVSTTGYKSENQFYSALTASISTSPATLSPLNQAINRFGILGGDYVNMNAGSLDPTGNPLDVAVEGPGFLTIQTAAGVRYTRNGNLHLNTKGQLVTPNGDVVLGQGGPLKIPGLGSVGPMNIPSGQISISQEGTISANGSMVGRLVLSEFASGTSLAPEGSLYFSAPANSAHLATNSVVRQGALEDSNMNPVSGAVDLISIERDAQLMMRAVSIFDTDFDKTAAEQIARD